MKLFAALVLALVVSANAFAYSSAPAGDPVLGFRDIETKTVVKSETAGYSDAISKGHAVFYEDGSGIPDGLYTVSRDYSGTYNTSVASLTAHACIASKAVATGDQGGFPCVTKGYVDYALYSVASASTPIQAGNYLCITDAATAKGRLVSCASGVVSQFVALEAKTSVADGTIKIAVQAR